MKYKILYTIIFIHLVGLIFSQNWTVFNKDYRYNYSLENESYTTVVIFADSILTQGNDTIYSLNRIATKCDSCWFYYPEPGVIDSNYIMINQPQFMQRRIVYSNNQYRLSDTSNYIIPRYLSVGNSWIFNTSRNITAQVINADIKNYFGVSDSVNVILLSTNDTIIISKQFGIVKYPAKFGQNQYYRLRGIENKTLYEINSLYGEKVPNFYDFFKLKPGVVHYYSATKSYSGFSNTCYYYYYAKKTVMSSMVSGDTIYNSSIDDVKGCLGSCPSGQGGFCWVSNPNTFPLLPINTYTNNNIPSTQINMNNQFHQNSYNSYNNEVIFPVTGLNQNAYVVRFGKTKNNHFYKTWGSSCFSGYLEEHVDSASLYYFQKSTLNNNVFYAKGFTFSDDGVGMTYIEGYGRVNLFYPAFESRDFYCTSLIIDGTDSLGATINYGIPSNSIDNEISNNSIVYPNPTKDIVTIYFPFETTGNSGTVEIRDIYGKIISHKSITSGTSSEKINLQNFAQGIYFVDVKIPHFQKQYKVIKE